MQTTIYTQECTLVHTQQIDMKVYVFMHTHIQGLKSCTCLHTYKQNASREIHAHTNTRSHEFSCTFIHIYMHACTLPQNNLHVNAHACS